MCVCEIVVLYVIMYNMFDSGFSRVRMNSSVLLLIFNNMYILFFKDPTTIKLWIFRMSYWFINARV